MIKIIKYIFKRVTCRHEYEQVCKLIGRNINVNKQITLNITYRCVHCEKEITIDMFDKYNQ